MATSVRYWAVALVMGLVAGLAWPAAAAERMVVHEWGTFTQFQDDQGRPLGGINVDDEPLPKFVHNLRRDLLLPPTPLSYLDMKGAPQRHPLVTLRLETPVLYFYPPQGQTLPVELDVHVDFRGGWLTEFFPKAEAHAPGLSTERFDFGKLTPKTVSSLEWNNVRVGTQAPGPETDAHVWLAPRRTGAASLTAASGESEKYLFYRGVGQFQAPLRVTTQPSDGRLTLRSNFAEVLGAKEEVSLGPLWLVHVRPDGTSAFRTWKPLTVTADTGRELATAPGTFGAQDYATDNLGRLSEAMQRALVADGLFADEASALLETWRQAYFKSPGLRLFCLVPQVWTDHYLPLRVSVPCDVSRVMVARIELVSPEQRALLEDLRGMTGFDARWLHKAYETPEARALFEGRSPAGQPPIQIPPEYQKYLDLGRFRNALILHDQKHRPSNALVEFIQVYGLEAFRWDQE